VIGLYVASGRVLGEGTLDWAALREIASQIPESTQLWIFAGFAVAFAIKAPLVPLHTWLPYAGAEAPTGTSTLLVTLMDKVGTFGFLRICLPLLPAASHDYAWLLLVMAAIGILYGAIVAAGQTDLKRFVTYTSIAHFGFIALGIFAFTTQAMTGAVLYMVNHGITTGLLFIIVGMLINRGRSRFVRDYGGVWKVAPILGGVFMVATMATIALPGTNSFISEFLVLIGTFRRSIAWGTIGTVGIILAAVYMLWIFQQTMTGPIRGKAVVDDDEGPTTEPVYSAAELSQMGPAGSVLPDGVTATAVHPLVKSHKTRFGDLTRREIAVVAPLVAAIIFLGLYPTPVLDVIGPTVAQTMSDVGSTNPPPGIQVGAASDASSEGGN
jgi:NADH-quinone oxidoreductase subunit M